MKKIGIVFIFGYIQSIHGMLKIVQSENESAKYSISAHNETFPLTKEEIKRSGTLLKMLADTTENKEDTEPQYIHFNLPSHLEPHIFTVLKARVLPKNISLSEILPITQVADFFETASLNDLIHKCAQLFVARSMLNNTTIDLRSVEELQYTPDSIRSLISHYLCTDRKPIIQRIRTSKIPATISFSSNTLLQIAMPEDPIDTPHIFDVNKKIYIPNPSNNSNQRFESPNGKYICSIKPSQTEQEFTYEIQDTEDNFSCIISGQKYSPHTFQYCSPSSDYIAIPGTRKDMYVLSSKNNTIKTLASDIPIISFAFSQNSHYAALISKYPVTAQYFTEHNLPPFYRGKEVQENGAYTRFLLTIYNTSNNRVLQQIGDNGNVRNVFFVDDNTCGLLFDDRSLDIIDLARNKLQHTIHNIIQQTTHSPLKNNNQYALIHSDIHTIDVIDVKKNTPIFSYTSPSLCVGKTLSQDGSMIALVDKERGKTPNIHVHVFDIKTALPILSYTIDDGNFHGNQIYFSPDNSHLALIHGKEILYIPLPPKKLSAYHLSLEQSLLAYILKKNPNLISSITEHASTQKELWESLPSVIQSYLRAGDNPILYTPRSRQ